MVKRVCEFFLLQKRSPGRPRDKATDKAILETATFLLKKEGYASFSLEALAKQAGVSRTTLYRRWPNKMALALFLLEQQTPSAKATFHEGSTQEKVFVLLRKIVAMHRGSLGRLFLQLLAACRDDKAHLTLFRRRFLVPNRAQLRAILSEGVYKGEIERSVDKTLAADALMGPLLLALAYGDSISDREIAEHIDLVLRGIAARS